MNLADAVAQAPSQARKGPRCWYARAHTVYTPDELALLDTLVAEVRDDRRTAASVARILTKTGLRISPDQASYHMRGDCMCGKE